jgi:beta-aspartyl-peptidase (threonine type)
MNSTKATLLLVALVFVFSSQCMRLAPAEQSDTDVEREVRKVLDRQVTEWNKGNLDGFLETYWYSPKVIFQSGADRNEGWEAMRARYRKRYQGEGREMGRLAFSGLDVIVFTPESAFARGRWKLTLSDGKTPSGLFTVILRKLPEGRRIIQDHTS